MQIQWNFFSLIFTVLFISLCDKYCKSWRGDFPRVRPIGFQQFLLLGFFYYFYLFFLRERRLWFSIPRDFFHCCNCINSKIISSVITIHILKTGWWGNSISLSNKNNNKPCAFQPCYKYQEKTLIKRVISHETTARERNLANVSNSKTNEWTYAVCLFKRK